MLSGVEVRTLRMIRRHSLRGYKGKKKAAGFPSLIRFIFDLFCCLCPWYVQCLLLSSSKDLGTATAVRESFCCAA
jgi:hypothetical protein